MSVLNLVSLLTIFPETVGQGIGPNGTSGVSTGTEWETEESGGDAWQIPHLPSSLDVSSIQIEEVTPESAKRRIMETQRGQQTLRNTEFQFSSYFTGLGSALADGVTAPETALGVLLENCLGGAARLATHTASGGSHTTTVVNVDAVTTWAVGGIIAWEDADGRLHPRVITDISTLAVTVEPAWPSAPSDDDLIRGGTTFYIDEDVIGDTSSNLGSTFSAVIQKGSNGSAGWELNMCKAGLKAINFARNEFASLEFNVASGRHTDPSDGPDPEFPTATYPTPQVIGPDSTIIIGDAGTTTVVEPCNGTVTVDPGVPVVPLECMVDNLNTTGGYGLFSTGPADTLVNVDLFPYSSSWYTDKAALTNKRILVAKNGSSGNCFAFVAENCEITTVSPGNGDFTSVEPVLRAVEVNPDTATTALERSKFKLYIG